MTSVLCFADFELRASQRRLLKNGLPLQTAGRALSLLPAPVAQRHRLVGQAELLGLCWPGAATAAVLFRVLTDLAALAPLLDDNRVAVLVAAQG